MKTGERVLFFLRYREAPIFEGKTWVEKKFWCVPTPSTGDFKIRDGKLHGGWYFVSYPHGMWGADASTVLALVRGYVLHKGGEKPEKALSVISDRLSLQRVDALLKTNGQGSAEDFQELHWLLMAQSEFGEGKNVPAVLRAAGIPNALVQVGVALALRSATPSDEVLEALSSLLLVKNTFVQAEAARTIALREFPRDKVIQVLLKALPDSDPHGQSPSGFMDPLRNKSASGREMIIRVLTHYGAEKEAHDGLIGFFKDEDITESVMLALADHFVRFPSEKARERILEMYGHCPDHAVPLFHSYLLREKSGPSLGAVYRRIFDMRLADRFLIPAFDEFEKALPPGDPRPIELAREIIRKAKPDHGEALVFAMKKVLPGARDKDVENAVKALGVAELDYYRRGNAFTVLAAEVPKGEPRVQRALIEGLEKYTKNKAIDYIFFACIAQASPEIERLLLKVDTGQKEEGKPVKVWEGLPPNPEALAMAKMGVELVLRPPGSPRDTLDAWLRLLEQEAKLGYGTEILLSEISRITPADLRGYAMDEIRRRLHPRRVVIALEVLEKHGWKISGK